MCRYSGLEAAAVVLSLDCLSVQEMHKVMVWSSAAKPGLALRDQALDHNIAALKATLDVDLWQSIPAILDNMVSSGSQGYIVPAADPHRVRHMAALAVLETKALVSKEVGFAGASVWKFTERGLQILCTLSSNAPLLSLRSLAPEHLSAYELVNWLDENNWDHLILTDKKVHH